MKAPATWKEALLFWWKLGWISFGGPAGQIAIMYQELVERKKWIDEEHFQRALSYCMVLPGPEAQQLATYCGWLLHGRVGGLIAGTLFILPSFFILSLLSWLYLLYGQLPEVQGLMVGLQAAVVAIVLAAAYRIGTKSLKSLGHVAIAVLAFVALVWGKIPFPWILLGAACLSTLLPRTSPSPSTGRVPVAFGWAKFGRQSLLLSLYFLIAGLLPLLILGWLHLLPEALVPIPLFFTKMALITFGGAYAVLPYLCAQASGVYHWVTSEQMIAGLALGETTPGPLIMIVTFVGFVAGWPYGPLTAWVGASAATFYMFLPSFYFIVVGAPLIEHLKDLAWLNRLLAGITAAVVGIILTLGLNFAQVVFLHQGQWNFLPLGLSILSLVLLLRFKMNLLLLIPLMAGLGWLSTLFFK